MLVAPVSASLCEKKPASNNALSLVHIPTCFQNPKQQQQQTNAVLHSRLKLSSKHNERKAKLQLTTVTTVLNANTNTTPAQNWSKQLPQLVLSAGRPDSRDIAVYMFTGGTKLTILSVTEIVLLSA
jgi:hypothetical protein